MCWCLVLLYCVSTNYTQSLGRVDQPLEEDFKVLFREQGDYRKNIEYTYNGWHKNCYSIHEFTSKPCEMLFIILYGIHVDIIL